jgi:spore cortex biosynthesis protein YabQ
VQLEYIACVFSCGWMMGIVFDFYNTVTGVSKWLRWLRPILDISFWCLSAVFVYYLTFITDSGRFRLYTFGLIAVGYLIYRLILHHYVVGSAFAIVRLVGMMLRLIWKLIDAVLLAPIRVALRLVSGLSRMVYWIGCKVEDVVAWLLRIGVTVICLPLRRPWVLTAPLRNQIEQYVEGMYEQASKWLKRRHESV